MQTNARGTYEKLQIARGKQGNVRGQYGSGCKVPGKCRGMQVNARETYRRECKLPGECRGMPGKHIGVSVNCQVNAGYAGECQGNVWQWVYSSRGMQGTTRGIQRSGCKVLAE